MTPPPPVDALAELPDPYHAVAEWLKVGRASEPPWPVGTLHADAIWSAWWAAWGGAYDRAGLVDRWRVVAAVWPDVLGVLMCRATAVMIDKRFTDPMWSAIRAGDFEAGARAFERARTGPWGAFERAFRHGLYELLPEPPPLAALVAPTAPPPAPPRPDPLWQVVFPREHPLDRGGGTPAREGLADDRLAGALARSRSLYPLMVYVERHAAREAVEALLSAFAREVVDLLDEPDRRILDLDALAAEARLRALEDLPLSRGARAAEGILRLVVLRRLQAAAPRSAYRHSCEVDRAGDLLHATRLHRYLRTHQAGLLRGEAVGAPPDRGAIADSIRSALGVAPAARAGRPATATPDLRRGVCVERVRVLRYPGVPADAEFTFHRGVNALPRVGDDDGAAVRALLLRILQSDFPRLPPAELAIEFALSTPDDRLRVEINVEPGWVQMFVEPMREGRAQHLRTCLFSAVEGTWATEPGRLAALVDGRCGAAWSRCREILALPAGLEAYSALTGRAEARVGRDPWGDWKAGAGRLVPPEVERWLVRDAIHAADLRDGPRTSEAQVAPLASLARALGFASVEIGAAPPEVEAPARRAPRSADVLWRSDPYWWRFRGFEVRFKRDDGALVAADDLDEGARTLVGLCWHAAVDGGPLFIDEALRGLRPHELAAFAEVLEHRQSFVAREADLHRLARSRPVAPPERVSIVYHGRTRAPADAPSR